MNFNITKKNKKRLEKIGFVKKKNGLFLEL